MKSKNIKLLQDMIADVRDELNSAWTSGDVEMYCRVKEEGTNAGKQILRKVQELLQQYSRDSCEANNAAFQQLRESVDESLKGANDTTLLSEMVQQLSDNHAKMSARIAKEESALEVIAGRTTTTIFRLNGLEEKLLVELQSAMNARIEEILPQALVSELKSSVKEHVEGLLPQAIPNNNICPDCTAMQSRVLELEQALEQSQKDMRHIVTRLCALESYDGKEHDKLKQYVDERIGTSNRSLVGLVTSTNEGVMADLRSNIRAQQETLDETVSRIVDLEMFKKEVETKLVRLSTEDTCQRGIVECVEESLKDLKEAYVATRDRLGQQLDALTELAGERQKTITGLANTVAAHKTNIAYILWVLESQEKDHAWTTEHVEALEDLDMNRILEDFQDLRDNVESDREKNAKAVQDCLDVCTGVRAELANIQFLHQKDIQNIVAATNPFHQDKARLEAFEDRLNPLLDYAIIPKERLEQITHALQTLRYQPDMDQQTTVAEIRETLLSLGDVAGWLKQA